MVGTERRRNMRAESCRACGKACEAGQGYLYRDTHNRRRNRYTGAFLWFVKCEECHGGDKTRLTIASEKYAAAHANDPVVRPWSVSQVKKWAVTRTEHEGDIAIRVEAGTFSEVVSYRDHINSRFSAPTGYSLEQHEFAGKPLSQKAADELGARILPMLVAIQNEEQAAGEAAVAKLVAAGATAKPCPSGYGWRVEYKGGDYCLWGCVEGKNKITGIGRKGVAGQWVETTAEELIAAE
jgi:hypothetical protein